MTTYLPSNWGARFLEEVIVRDPAATFRTGMTSIPGVGYIEGFRFISSPPIDQYGVKRQVMDIVLGR